MEVKKLNIPEKHSNKNLNPSVPGFRLHGTTSIKTFPPTPAPRITLEQHETRKEIDSLLNAVELTRANLYHKKNLPKIEQILLRYLNSFMIALLKLAELNDER